MKSFCNSGQSKSIFQSSNEIGKTSTETICGACLEVVYSLQGTSMGALARSREGLDA